jgi:hypothetical protein
VHFLQARGYKQQTFETNCATLLRAKKPIIKRGKSSSHPHPSIQNHAQTYMMSSISNSTYKTRKKNHPVAFVSNFARSSLDVTSCRECWQFVSYLRPLNSTEQSHATETLTYIGEY